MTQTGTQRLGIGLMVCGALFLVAQGTSVVPTCQNFAGTTLDSGYPCKVTHSNASTEWAFSRTRSVSLPSGFILGALLAASGLILLRKGRGREEQD